LAEGERRLAAIMFTDIVGYTALGQRNEALSLTLLQDQRKLIRPILKKHKGREVKTMGDAFLVDFPSALEAVRCAHDIQRAAREFNLSVLADRKLRLRIGVHLGDIVESQGDISGDAVNVASRIEPLAEDGGVCITRQVFDQVQNKFELKLASLGNKRLKNVNIPVEVFKVVMPWNEEKDAPSIQLNRNRVAVLPFANMSPDPNDAYFTDGMTEELISALSKLPRLSVISRTSIMQYKNQSKSVKEIGRELDAGTLLEGSVRKSGNRVRIAVQLIDANTDNHLWAETYDRNLDDVFDIQSDVASKVSASLKAGVLADLPRADTADIAAYTTYVRAMQLFHKSSEKDLREAVALLQDVVSRDPSFIRAHVGLASLFIRMANYGYEDFSIISEKAEVEARRAMEIEPSSAESHAVLAVALGYYDRFDESISEAETAIRINPNVSDAYHTLGFGYSSMGELDKGIKFLRKALELDPLSIQKARFLALTLGAVGRIAEAREVLSRIQRFYPDDPLIFLGLADCYLFESDFANAQEMVDHGLSADPEQPLLIIDQGLIYVFTGKREKALEILQTLQNHKSDSIRNFSKLFIQAALGNYDEAFKALMRGSETHAWPFLIKTLPVFEGLRKDPRFTEFCLKMGLPT
jgi:adenylate cyclase